ncbi:UDP-glucose/GDP-mannose dehydrogenase family, NAD binding domain-containing protein [Aspergillus alliaceus]|uniref:UDP-glucose/GDP-mannose dehydrogenase family, NAD binding domain-containing protein n=1 Tax=Petromyces alliaceus TaxID=209559 RepID=UPI0012A6EC20|nr:UDP-glucose/GDP-mannose dehydrogenase family, NAD binding domain-containing protein [Aspergillus alliaceus]KAB8238786.1 UDP-glucose/GDP-mannose dehydrogenase family, NAD binding domain-containing protein [Aspergillus alliaceus]
MIWIARSIVLAGVDFTLGWWQCNRTHSKRLRLATTGKVHESIHNDDLQSDSKVTEPGTICEVCFIGAGYVGALTAIVLASKNPNRCFTVVNKDDGLIAAWDSDQLPIFEPGLEDVLFVDGVHHERQTSEAPQRRRLQNIRFSTAMDKWIAAADIIFVCVDTPLSETLDPSSGAVGLNHKNVKAAIRRIAELSTGCQIVVLKSTVPCGTVGEIEKVFESEATPAASLDILSCPEFLAQGSTIRDLLLPNRLVIGHIPRSAEAVGALKTLYEWVSAERIIIMDAWSSELAKIASNAFIGQRISSINSLSTLAVIHLNDWQNRRILTRPTSHLTRGLGLQGRRAVAILGLTFKKNTLDTRNSTAIGLIQGLIQHGAEPRLYEPHLQYSQIESVIGPMASRIVVSSIEAARDGCHALVIHTNWDTFKHNGDYWGRISRLMGPPKVLLDPWGITELWQYGAVRV